MDISLEMPDFKIVDFHLHLPVAQDDWLKPHRDRYIKENGMERYQELKAMESRNKSWLAEFCFPQPEEPSENYMWVANRWSEECKKYNLDKVVFATGGGNNILTQVVNSDKEHFVGFAHHYMGEAGAAQELEKAIKYDGLKGYKILAPVVDKPLNSRDFDEVFEVCHEYELPVLIHFGILGGAGGVVSGPNMNPLILAEVTKRFPKANFIVPHFGCGYTNELLQLCWSSPNVSVDTSGNNLWTKWTMESYTLEQLFAKFYATIGPERIIFGSDSEWFPRGFAIRYLLDQLRAVRYIGMSEENIKLIFRENALRLLKL